MWSTLSKNIKLNVDNSKITLNTTYISPSLSYKFLEETLLEYFNDEIKTTEICEFIKRRRENNKKTNTSLKRIRNKTELEKK